MIEEVETRDIEYINLNNMENEILRFKRSLIFTGAIIGSVFLSFSILYFFFSI
jgi:hypothetical protein